MTKAGPVKMFLSLKIILKFIFNVFLLFLPLQNPFGDDWRNFFGSKKCTVIKVLRLLGPRPVAAIRNAAQLLSELEDMDRADRHPKKTDRTKQTHKKTKTKNYWVKNVSNFLSSFIKETKPMCPPPCKTKNELNWEVESPQFFFRIQ